MDNLLQDLTVKGWSVSLDFIPPSICWNLREEMESSLLQKEFRPAQIGKGAEKSLRPDIRNDAIFWLTPHQGSEFQQFYWNKMEELKTSLQEHFFLGSMELEAHFAIFSKNSYYKKHLDQFREQKESPRLISCSLYLNDHWEFKKGGALRIYSRENPDQVEVEVVPHMGTFVCFLADSIYHEVLPTQWDRYSLTGWMKKSGPQFKLM